MQDIFNSRIFTIEEANDAIEKVVETYDVSQMTSLGWLYDDGIISEDIYDALYDEMSSGLELPYRYGYHGGGSPYGTERQV